MLWYTNVWVDFSDNCGTWRERGNLRRGGKDGRSFILEVDESHGGGTRVLNLSNRRAEVYQEGERETVLLIVNDGKVEQALPSFMAKIPNRRARQIRS